MLLAHNAYSKRWPYGLRHAAEIPRRLYLQYDREKAFDHGVDLFRHLELTEMAGAYGLSKHEVRTDLMKASHVGAWLWLVGGDVECGGFPARQASQAAFRRRLIKQEATVAIEFNHTIVPAHDKVASATYFARISSSVRSAFKTNRDT